MPLSATGKKVMGAMTRQYGAKKGKSVFYATMKKKKKKKWHKSRNYSAGAVARARRVA